MNQKALIPSAINNTVLIREIRVKYFLQTLRPLTLDYRPMLPSLSEANHPFFYDVFEILPNQLFRPLHRVIRPPLRMHIHHNLIRQFVVLDFFN